MAHRHSVYDTDNHFLVDPVSRMIISQCKKTKLIQYDHNSERFTFQVPRYIEGHDMSSCNEIAIKFSNYAADASGFSTGRYDVTDMQVSPDGDDVIIFSWLISGEATVYAGELLFGICFMCTVDSTVHYAWHTDTFDGICVDEGVRNNVTLF